MNKGFTLIELLAVIVILAIILVVAVPRIMKVIDASKINAYISNEKLIVKSTELYVSKNIDKLPANTGETTEVLLSDLITDEYIKEIKSPFDKNNNCSGYILITKTGTDLYDYTPHINCIDSIDNVVDDGLVAYWNFNGNMFNNSFNNLHGNTVDTTVGQTSDRFENSNKALAFNGGRVETADVTAFLGNNTTWIAWVKRDISNNTFNMFMGQHLPYFSFRDTGQFFFSINIGGTQRSLYSLSTYQNNIWYYYVATYDGQYMRIYINGENDGSLNIPGTVQYHPSYLFTIGDGVNTNWYKFIGSVDDVRIYNRTLSAEEIKNLYNIEKNRSR